MDTTQKLTLSNHAPAPGDDHSLTVGPNGPILLQDIALVTKLANFDRERIPERVVHAKGYGIHGYFETTHDMSKYTKAHFLSKPGIRTPMFARFSTVAGERGSADTVRDPRGFALKFYTQDGNYDMVGNNTPVFFINDGIKFPDFIHTQKRDPRTNCKDPTMWYDFWRRRPESVQQVVWLMGPRGLPRTLHTMNGYSSHAYKFVNEKGEHCWFKWHFKAAEGCKNFSQEEGNKIAGTDPDYHQREMFNYIEAGNKAIWNANVQIMTAEQARNLGYNPFDITLVWRHADFPLIPVGRMVLNRMPKNYFAEVEQAAFSPSNVVPGIEPSPDKMLQVRLFSYPDTHRHRLGKNFEQIPINIPYRAKGLNGYRDGYSTVDGNQGDLPNYNPNSFNPAKATNPEHPEYFAGRMVRASSWGPEEHFRQAGDLWAKVFSNSDRAECLSNLVGTLGAVSKRSIVVDMVRLFNKCHHTLGAGLCKGLDIQLSELRE